LNGVIRIKKIHVKCTESSSSPVQRERAHKTMRKLEFFEKSFSITIYFEWGYDKKKYM